MLKILNRQYSINPKIFFNFFTLPVFSILLILFFIKFQYYFEGGDALCYGEIALKYNNGYFYDAINAYWSPLYSWIASPLLWITEKPVYVFKFINAAAAVLCLLKLKTIVSKLSLSGYIEILLQFSFAFALSFFAFTDLTPDLLNLYFLLLYLDSIINNSVFQKPLKTGLIGVLLYLSKHYTFWFFLVHLVLSFLIEKLNSRKGTPHLIPFLKTLAIFITGCGIWILIVSVKYGRPVLSTAGSYNHSVVASGEINHPFTSAGIVPPYRNNLFAWEEITLSYNYRDWSPFDSKKSVATQWKLIKDNFLVVVNFLNATTRYGFFINLLILLLLFRYHGFKKELLQNINFKLFLFGIVFFAGYLYILCNYRYIRVLYFLSALSIGIFADRVLKEQKNKLIHALAILPMAYCFCTYFIGNSFYPVNKDVSYAPGNISNIKKLLGSKDRIISSIPFFGYPLVTESRCRYYGSYNGYNKNDSALLMDIKKYRITAVMMPDTTTYIPSFFSGFQKIDTLLKGMYLYKIDTALLIKLEN